MYNVKFFVPADYPVSRRATVLASQAAVDAPTASVSAWTTLRLYACEVDLVCRQQLHDFGPVTLSDAGSLPAGAEWIGVAPVDDQLTSRFHLSRDAGRSWQPWTAVDALFPRGVPRRFYAISVSSSPDRPDRWYLQLTFRPSLRSRHPRAPAHLLFRSDNAGRSWQPLGYSRDRLDPSRDRGTLPWNSPGPAWETDHDGHTGRLHALPAGRLYVRAATQAPNGTWAWRGLFCSADAGRTWRRGGGC